MRTKTVIAGFKNSQKIRIIVNRVPIFTTVYDAAFNLFGDKNINAACWVTMEKLATMRRVAKLDKAPVPSGLVYNYGSYNNEVQVQIDLI